MVSRTVLRNTQPQGCARARGVSSVISCEDRRLVVIKMRRSLGMRKGLPLLLGCLTSHASAFRRQLVGTPWIPLHAARVRIICSMTSSDGDNSLAPKSSRGVRAVSERAKKTVAYQQGYACASCGCMLPPSYQVDHIVPIAMGGSNGLANLQALCLSCHTQKTRDQRHELMAHTKATEDISSGSRALGRMPGSKLGSELADVADDACADEDGADEGRAGESGEAVREERLDGKVPAHSVNDRGGADGEGGSDGVGSGGGASGAVRRQVERRRAHRGDATGERWRAAGSSAMAFSPLQLLNGMNRQQLNAVLCTSRHVRLAAGPGTGKTRCLTARIAYLVATGVAWPSRILAVTFTNKAARELRERLSDILGPVEAEKLTMGTFHSLCLAMLRR